MIIKTFYDGKIFKMKNLGTYPCIYPYAYGAVKYKNMSL